MRFGAQTPQNLGKLFYCIFDRYDGPDQESRGCGAVTPELSEKSKMATNMACKQNFGHISCCIYATDTILVSNHMFSNTNTGNSFQCIFQDIINIYWENSNYHIHFAKINGHSCHQHWCLKFLSYLWLHQMLFCPIDAMSLLIKVTSTGSMAMSACMAMDVVCDNVWLICF